VLSEAAHTQKRTSPPGFGNAKEGDDPGLKVAEEGIVTQADQVADG
jgi:hypothetical protein